MKPVLAFVLGIALASGVAYVVVEKKQSTNAARPTSSTGTPATFTPPGAAAKPDPGAVSSPALAETASVSPPDVTAEPAEQQAAAPPSRVARPQRHSAFGTRESRPERVRVREAVYESGSVTPAAAPKPQQQPPQQVAQNTPPPMPQPAPAQDPGSGDWRHFGGNGQPQQAPPQQPVYNERPVERHPAPQQQVPQPHTVTIPAGTSLVVRLEESLSTDRRYAGDAFRASLAQPLVVDGFVIAERGARAQGRITELDKGGRVQGLAHMSIQLTSLDTSDGQHISLQTSPFTKQAQTTHRQDAAKIGGGAALGAIIGAIAGGGRGAAIGTVAGGAAGGADVAMTRGAQVNLPVETRVIFRLAQPITLTEKLD